MNMDDYEKRVDELKAEAERLQASMMAMKNLRRCYDGDHAWEVAVDDDRFHTVVEVDLYCTKCAAQVTILGEFVLHMPDNMKWGELAGEKLTSLDFTPTPVPEIPEQQPAQQAKTEGGAYRVDVSTILGTQESDENE